MKELIEELNIVKDLLTPSEILLTVDALIGQDASNIAFEFNRKVGVTGNLLSKVDGDAKGGAALSIRYSLLFIPQCSLSSARDLLLGSLTLSNKTRTSSYFMHKN